jgi:lipid A 3-O-deacylase
MSLRTVLLAAALLAALPAQADWRPDAVFLEAGAAPRGTWAVTAGMKWDTGWRRQGLGSEASASVDLQLSRWSWHSFNGGRTGSDLLAVVPLLRLRFDNGRSPWFAEGGIGLSITDKRYDTPNKQFSTAWNFYDVLAVGHSFGAAREKELSVRINHNSNGGAKHPNPGENFLQVRWVSRF